MTCLSTLRVKKFGDGGEGAAFMTTNDIAFFVDVEFTFSNNIVCYLLDGHL